MSQTLTGKVKKSELVNTWLHSGGKTNYNFDVWFEGETVPCKIIAQSEKPDFLSTGSTLTYEWKDISKRTIRRILQTPTNETKSTTSTYVDNSVGAMVGNAINNAVNLAIAGIITFDNLETAARDICSMSNKLKQEFSNNKN